MESMCTNCRYYRLLCEEPFCARYNDYIPIFRFIANAKCHNFKLKERKDGNELLRSSNKTNV